MKKMLKQGVSLLIVLTLLLTSMSIPTFADQSNEIFTVNNIRYQILDASSSGGNAVEVISSNDKDENGRIPDSEYSGG